MNNSQLNMLVQLATIDNELAGKESKWIKELGKKLGHTEAEIFEVFRKPNETVDFKYLSQEQRFEYLFNLIQLMKIDGKVFLSEITFCKKAAEKLGYKSNVVGSISSGIFSDPSITSDKSALFKKANKYLLYKVN